MSTQKQHGTKNVRSTDESLTVPQVAPRLKMSPFNLRYLLYHNSHSVGGVTEAFLPCESQDDKSGAIPSRYGVLGRKIKDRWKLWLVCPWSVLRSKSDSDR